MAAAAILNFTKFSFWSREQNQVQHLLVYRISSKLDDFLVRYGDLTIFEMVAVRHLGF